MAKLVISKTPSGERTLWPFNCQKVVHDTHLVNGKHLLKPGLTPKESIPCGLADAMVRILCKANRVFGRTGLDSSQSDHHTHLVDGNHLLSLIQDVGLSRGCEARQVGWVALREGLQFVPR
eukprot:1157619-Pelagomonas_calceolata.AAC.12